MQVKHIQNNDKGYFVATVQGKDAGLMTYVNVDNDRFVIDHTEVNDEFTGQGVGKAMVMDAVKYARENDKKILPLCSFAKSVFNKNTDIDDVLYRS